MIPSWLNLERGYFYWYMSLFERIFKVVLMGALALLAGGVAEEVYEESGIAYEEGHPTAYGGVRGWNPLKSLELVGKIALRHIEDLLENGPLS